MKRLYTGVTKIKETSRYRARIRYDSKVYSKMFATKQEASDWYEDESLKLYGFDRIHEPDLRIEDTK